MRGDEGYTLTEMLVVIGIIALIAAVLTPGLIGQLGRARAKTAQMQLETVAGAVEAFRSDIGRYPNPAPDEGLAILVTAPATLDGWAGPYLKNTRYLNDPWGNPVVYVLTAGGQAFSVQSNGANGAAGGSGLDHDLQAP